MNGIWGGVKDKEDQTDTEKAKAQIAAQFSSKKPAASETKMMVTKDQKLWTPQEWKDYNSTGAVPKVPSSD